MHATQGRRIWVIDLAVRAGAAGRAEIIVLTGDPAEEIVKLAETREANLIVMGLHSSGALGPRMGSVTYRVLCLAHAPVLALPPVPTVVSRLPVAEGANIHSPR